MTNPLRNARLMLTTLVLLPACATPIPVHFGVHARPAPVVAISNPAFSDGDAAAGRRAFIEAQCIDCHRVAEDPNLPRGPRAAAGPILHDLRARTAKEVARAITSRSTGGNENLFGSTMQDYAQPLTARQLVDIVAYLRGTGRAG